MILMKRTRLERLEESYEIQKEIFERARARRIENRRQQIDELEEKIARLEAVRLKLLKETVEEKEFQDFETFRQRSTSQEG